MEVAGVEEEGLLEDPQMARQGLAGWWSRAGVRAGSGALYIAAPRRLPRTGFSGEVITAVRWLHRRVQRLSVVVGAPWFRLCANSVRIRSLRGSSTERGGAGPSTAESTLCACR